MKIVLSTDLVPKFILNGFGFIDGTMTWNEQRKLVVRYYIQICVSFMYTLNFVTMKVIFD